MASPPVHNPLKYRPRSWFATERTTRGPRRMIIIPKEEARWPSGRASDSGARGLAGLWKYHARLSRLGTWQLLTSAVLRSACPWTSEKILNASGQSLLKSIENAQSALFPKFLVFFL